MRTLTLNDGDGDFEVTVLDVAAASRMVLFAAGAGGNPQRHQPLLNALAEGGCSVVAPHFERLASPTPAVDVLHLRALRLRLALELVARPELPVAGVGHSIGGTMLLALAGAQAWTRARERAEIARDRRLDRLALVAPAMDFFGAPGALDRVQGAMVIWTGTLDALSSPAQAQRLSEALGPDAQADIRVIDGAGHFSFMHDPPPHTTQPLPDRAAFLAELTRDVCRFVIDGR